MRKVVSTEGAPGAIGPYSQAISYGQTLFCSGQVGLDPATGEIVEGGVKEQTARALENLGAVLEAGGSSFGNVVKTTVFLASMVDFAAMNEVYAEVFGSNPPARSTVAVKELPKGALVEIEAISVIV